MIEQEITNPADIDSRVKRRFFTNMAIGSKALMRVHHDSGQLNRYKPATTEGGKLERWGDPTQHCLVEAAGSKVLSKMLHLSPEDSATFYTTAMIHDAMKRSEIAAVAGAKALGKSPEEVDTINDFATMRSKQMLLNSGIDPAAVALTETVAHTSLDQFVFLDDDNQMCLKDDVPTLNLAMHYLDDITRGPNIVPFDERMDYLDSQASRYPYVEAGRAAWGGRNYFEAQREAGHLVENRLAEIAGIADPTTLPAVINTGLVEMITTTV